MTVPCLPSPPSWFPHIQSEPRTTLAPGNIPVAWWRVLSERDFGINTLKRKNIVTRYYYLVSFIQLPSDLHTLRYIMFRILGKWVSRPTNLIDYPHSYRFDVKLQNCVLSMLQAFMTTYNSTLRYHKYHKIPALGQLTRHNTWFLKRIFTLYTKSS